MNSINQISDIIKNWNIEKKQQEKIQELKHEILNCSEILGEIREELTKAYIVSNKIVLEEDTYYVMHEQDVRKSGKKDKDLDKKQRKEQQLLNDIYRLCEAEENIINKGTEVESEEDRKFYNKASNNILYRIVKILKKIIMSLTKSDSKKENKKQDILSLEDTIDKSLEMVKLYKDELKQRAEKINRMEEIQEQVNKYNSRIVKNPKEYNKEKPLTVKVQKILAENKKISNVK